MAIDLETEWLRLRGIRLATIIGRHYTGIGWSVQHHREPERMNVRWHRDDGSLSCLYPDWSLAEPG